MKRARGWSARGWRDKKISFKNKWLNNREVSEVQLIIDMFALKLH